jgi:hypothetical protein
MFLPYNKATYSRFQIVTSSAKNCSVKRDFFRSGNHNGTPSSSKDINWLKVTGDLLSESYWQIGVEQTWLIPHLAGLDKIAVSQPVNQGSIPFASVLQVNTCLSFFQQIPHLNTGCKAHILTKVSVILCSTFEWMLSKFLETDYNHITHPFNPKKKLRCFSPQANYTNRATIDCRQS